MVLNSRPQRPFFILFFDKHIHAIVQYDTLEVEILSYISAYIQLTVKLDGLCIDGSLVQPTTNTQIHTEHTVHKAHSIELNSS